MNILALDDERHALNHLEHELKIIFPYDTIRTAWEVSDGLLWAEELRSGGERLDYAFLDIRLCEMNGLELARRLKILHPQMLLFFCTGYSEYAIDAFGMCAKGYLLKPVSAEQIRHVLDEMVPNWQETANSLPMDIRVQTFGNFEIFVDGVPLSFERQKAKELLAYLVDRHGASVTTKEIAATLWEDRPYGLQQRNIVSTISASLQKTLNAAGIGDILIKSWGHLAIDVQKIKCDAYDYEQGDMVAVNCFHGEYMTNYSWAEFTTGKYIQMEQENRGKRGFPQK